MQYHFGELIGIAAAAASLYASVSYSPRMHRQTDLN
jgi:hypothetical protein